MEKELNTELEEIKKHFNEVHGYEAIKKELIQLCDVVKNTKTYEQFGIHMPHGLLLTGYPGVGKTLMATCFVNATKRNKFILRKTHIGEDFMKELDRVFNKAIESQPSIILLDDMDKFANGDSFHPDASEYVAVQTWLDNIKEKDVFVIATTNFLEVLPKSLLRSGRFDNQIEVPLPTFEEAKYIIKHYLSNKKYVDDLDYDLIARILSGYSSADLEKVINQAGIYAGFDGIKKVETKHIVRACMRVLFKAPESIDSYSEITKKRLAYHEAGHAVVQEMFMPESVNILSIRKTEGRTGGVTSWYYKEDDNLNIKNLEHRIMTSLGGKAATELVFGLVDMGAYNDIDKSIKMCGRIVDNYCGCGFENRTYYDCSNEAKNRKELAVANKLEEYYRQTKVLLAENKQFLDVLATALIENDFLTTYEIQEIKQSVQNNKI